jgi:cytochrome P450
MPELVQSAPGRRPAPRSLPLLGVLPAMRRDPLGVYLAAAREHGDVARLRFGPHRLFVLSHPDLIRHVLQDNHRNYRRSPIYARLRPLFGDGLFTSDGEHWERRRRLMQPPFLRRRLDPLVPLMVETVAAMLRRWETHAAGGDPLDVAEEMGRVTLEVVVRCLFGGGELGGKAAEAGQAMAVVEEEAARRLYALTTLSMLLPTPRNLRFRRALGAIDGIVRGIVAERRGTSRAATDDLLSLLLEARDPESGTGLDAAGLRDEAVTIFVAGHETSATALAWALHLLARHPEAERRLRAEADEVLGGDRDPDAADVPRLAYARMVLEEAMRLYPPVWRMGRAAIGGDEIGGREIPASSIVAFSQYVVHRHPALWEEPDRFDPERFRPGRETARPRYAYFPFGGGPRACLGGHFAMMEMTLLLAMAVRRFSLRAVPGHPVEPAPLITLRPRHGLPMTVERRRGA